MRPKIGILTCCVKENRHFVTDNYIQAIELAGGLSIIIPMTKVIHKEYLSLCDGFLFCGGGDITPLLFNQEPTFGLSETDLAFDLFQIKMMKSILKTRKPVLAICRGMQVLNVACGGSLIQDLASIKNAINHMQTSNNRTDFSHKVTFNPKSNLYKILGASTYVNSFHHQAIATLGHNLIISGQSKDQIIEAIEMPSHPFVIGVQWHPECMFQTSSKMRALFFNLINTNQSPM